MLRLYDWRCKRCGTEKEELVDVPHNTSPKQNIFTICKKCGKPQNHARILSVVAKYLGDRPLSPRIRGGSFDTLGFKKPPPIPEFTGETYGDFKDFVHTKEYEDTKKQRERVKRENKMKRARAKAGVSFRHNQLPGDPNLKT